MSTDYPHLQRPLDLGPLRVRNRIVFAAHLTNYAVDGLPTARHAAYYEARAAGGAGLIITEEHITDPADRPYEKLIRGFDTVVVPHYRRLTDAVHRHGVPVLAQLNNNGAQSSGMYSRATVLGPSAVADPLFREVPRVIEESDVAGIIAGFVGTAKNCVDGGFDGVELQASQSSILRAFLSRATNRRDDGYGGGVTNRARLLLEVVAAVRAELGPHRALGVRLSGVESVPDGTELDEAVETAELLDATGTVDYINTTMGVATARLHLVEPSMAVPRGYAMFASKAVRQAVSIPVIGIGLIKTPGDAEQALRDGACDLVGVVRGQIADPEFGVKALTGRGESIRHCLSCNQECVGRVGVNLDLGCVVNPVAGHEGEQLAPSTAARTVAVVGGGPAGLKAAATAAHRGHRVTLFEKDAQVGGRIRSAARAPARGELSDLVTDLERECVHAGVDIVRSTVVDSDLLGECDFDVLVCATGARPRRPEWAQASNRVVDVRDVLDGAVVPVGRVLVFDELGFHEATSVAELLAARGCSVTVATNAMVVGQDLDSTLDVAGWISRADAAGIERSTDVVPMGCADSADGSVDVVLLHHPTGVRSTVSVDWVVCAVHPQSVNGLWNAMQDSGIELHRCGDALTPRRASAAVREGYRVGLAI